MPQQSSQPSQPSPAVASNSRDPDTGARQRRACDATASKTCDCNYHCTCGVVTAPSQIASALRANDAVLVAAVRSSTTTLVRAEGRAGRWWSRERARRTIDRALLALDVECGTKIATTTSPRLKTVLAVFKEVSGTRRARWCSRRTSVAWKSLKDADVDVRGALGVGGFFASAASMETADTPLLRAARNCEPARHDGVCSSSARIRVYEMPATYEHWTWRSSARTGTSSASRRY